MKKIESYIALYQEYPGLKRLHVSPDGSIEIEFFEQPPQSVDIPSSQPSLPAKPKPTKRAVLQSLKHPIQAQDDEYNE